MPGFNQNKNNTLEKYYTSEVLLENLKGRVERLNPSSCLENSAGNGAIIDGVLKPLNLPYVAYDIYNEDKRDDIIEADYLKTKIDYEKGRVAVINPPFNKGLKFVYKALEECNHVVAVLSLNSLINIDYKKYWVDVDKIDVYKRFKFKSETEDDNNASVNIVVLNIRKKTENDKYDYDV